jgi:hypothetical protein
MITSTTTTADIRSRVNTFQQTGMREMGKKERDSYQVVAYKVVRGGYQGITFPW